MNHDCLLYGRHQYFRSSGSHVAEHHVLLAEPGPGRIVVRHRVVEVFVIVAGREVLAGMRAAGFLACAAETASVSATSTMFASSSAVTSSVLNTLLCLRGEGPRPGPAAAPPRPTPACIEDCSR